MTQHGKSEARALGTFIDRSPSPFHACATAAEMLSAAGFTRLHENEAWELSPGRYYVVRGGSLVAWATGANHGPGDIESVDAEITTLTSKVLK